MNQKIIFRTLTFMVSLFILFPIFMPAAVQIQGGMQINLGMPAGQFKKNINSSLFGPGFCAYLGIKPTKLPLAIGLKISQFWYGRDSREETMAVPEFGDVKFKVSHSYDLFTALLYIRFQPLARGFLQPYAEVSAGIDSLSAQVTIPAYSSEGSGYLISQSVKKDTTFAYGGECGLLIPLNGRKTKSKTISLIEAGARYSTSRNAEYLHKGSIIIQEGNAIYISSFSPVKIFTVHLGWTIRYH